MKAGRSDAFRWPEKIIDGKRCLLGAIDRVRWESGLVDNRATEYLAVAINQWQMAKGLPPLGNSAAVTVIGFNDAKAKELAAIDTFHC